MCYWPGIYLKVNFGISKQMNVDSQSSYDPSVFIFDSTNQNSGLADIVIVSKITASFSAVKVSFIKYISTILNEENQENY